MFSQHYSDVESVVVVAGYHVKPAVDVVDVGFLVDPNVDVAVGSAASVVASVVTGSVVAGLMQWKRLAFVESMGMVYSFVIKKSE